MTRFAILAALVAVFAGAPAHAQTTEAAKKTPRFDLFRVIDANADEKITADEAKANALTYFDKIDVNTDGLILPDELQIRAQDVHKLQNGQSADMNDAMAKRLNDNAMRQMKAIDVNADGKVTRDEYASRAVERYRISDANNDGHVTRDEFQARGRTIAKSQRDRLKQETDKGVTTPLPPAQ
jgi:Ca2+-binding EF-hand superfamily protein